MKSTTYALVAVAAIAAFALLREHWSHVAGYWPYRRSAVYKQHGRRGWR